MTPYRATISWRGPGGIRRDTTSTVRDFPQMVELLSKGPDGWTVAVVSLLDEEPHVVDKFAVWRRQLEDGTSGEVLPC